MLTETRNDICHFFTDEHNWYQGEYKSMYKNGQLYRHCFYIDDKLNGECKVWHEDGNIWAHATYVDNNKHGKYIQWHDNGNIRVCCFFDNGVLHGKYDLYWRDGIKKQHCFYVNGKYTPFEEISYPTTEEELLYFKLKYNLPLLPVETKC